MNIELHIDGEKKLFTAPFRPMAARRKYLEIQANAEEREKTTPKDILHDDAEYLSILADVVFQGQFTVEQLLNGVSDEYFNEKLSEAIWGIKKDKANDSKKK